MSIDLGLQGWALLVLPALAFGALVQLVLWRRSPHWLWAAVAVGWVIGGLVMSEGLFGAETTEENLQPLVDGLLVDESLLGGLIGGCLAAALAYLFAGRTGHGHVPAH